MTLTSLEKVPLNSELTNGNGLSPVEQSTQYGHLKLLLNAVDDLSASSLSLEDLKVTFRFFILDRVTKNK